MSGMFYSDYNCIKENTCLHISMIYEAPWLQILLLKSFSILMLHKSLKIFSNYKTFILEHHCTNFFFELPKMLLGTITKSFSNSFQNCNFNALFSFFLPFLKFSVFLLFPSSLFFNPKILTRLLIFTPYNKISPIGFSFPFLYFISFNFYVHEFRISGVFSECKKVWGSKLFSKVKKKGVKVFCLTGFCQNRGQVRHPSPLFFFKN